jgi:hypothetical protein
MHSPDAVLHDAGLIPNVARGRIGDPVHDDRYLCDDPRRPEAPLPGQ